MEAVEYLIYTLVFLVLIAFVGVIGYIIYDNYNYKNDLTTDLNTNFKGINKNFVSTTDIIGKVHVKHTSNLNALSDTLVNTSTRLDNKIDYVYSINQSSNVINNKDIDYVYSINQSSNVIIDSNLGNFGYNMNKYFEFNNNISTPAGYDSNKKLFEYRTDPGGTADTTKRLNLITQTTATAGLKINSDPTKNDSLQICNNTGAKCFQVLSTGDSLSIFKPPSAIGGKDIYIGGNDASAPLRISGEGNVYIKGALYTPPASPTPPEATATLTPTPIASIAIPGSSFTYTSVPTVTITGGGGPASTNVTPTLSGSTTGTINNIPAPVSSFTYTSVPTVTITASANTLTFTIDVSNVSFTSGSVTVNTAGLPSNVTYTTKPEVKVDNVLLDSANVTFSNGKVTNITVTSSYYSSKPSIVITGGGSTSTTVTPTLTATSIASITITSGRNGSGYTTTPPTVIISPSNGASATAILGSGATAGQVASINVGPSGSGFTTVPAITFTGGA